MHIWLVNQSISNRNLAVNAQYLDPIQDHEERAPSFICHHELYLVQECQIIFAKN